MTKTVQKKEKRSCGLKNTSVVMPNQEEVPFLYIAMREPSKDYKKANAPTDKLYRFIKLKK